MRGRPKRNLHTEAISRGGIIGRIGMWILALIALQLSAPHVSALHPMSPWAPIVASMPMMGPGSYYPPTYYTLHPMAAPHSPLPKAPQFPGAFLLPGQQPLHPVVHHAFAVPHAPLPTGLPILYHPGTVSAISSLGAVPVSLPGTGRPISLLSLSSFPPKKLEAQTGRVPFSLRDALGLSQARRNPAVMPNLPPHANSPAFPMRFRVARSAQMPLPQQLQQPQQLQTATTVPQQQFQVAQMSASAKNPQLMPGQFEGLTGAGFMQTANVSPGAVGAQPVQMSSSPLDPSGAFEKMHRSWVPNRPQTASTGVPSLAAADRFDGLTGAGFMALPDPGAGTKTPVQPRMNLRL